jgi:hypothetical protein
LGSQSTGLIMPVILGWPLIHDLPDQLISIRQKKKVAQTLGVLGPFLNWKSCLSIRNGALPHKQLICLMMNYMCPIWRSATCSHTVNCRCFSPSVFTLLPMHLDTLITSKLTLIWESFSLLTTSDLWEIWLKVSWSGEPLSYAARQISILTKRWPESPKAGWLGLTPCPSYPKKAAMLAQWIVPNWHFFTNLTEVFPMLFPQLQGKRQGTTRKGGAWPTLFPCKAAKFFCIYSNVNFKHDHSGFKSQLAFQPKLYPHIRPTVSGAMVFSLCTLRSSTTMGNC